MLVLSVVLSIYMGTPFAIFTELSRFVSESMQYNRYYLSNKDQIQRRDYMRKIKELAVKGASGVSGFFISHRFTSQAPLRFKSSAPRHIFIGSALRQGLFLYRPCFSVNKQFTAVCACSSSRH